MKTTKKQTHHTLCQIFKRELTTDDFLWWLYEHVGSLYWSSLCWRSWFKSLSRRRRNKQCNGDWWRKWPAPGLIVPTVKDWINLTWSSRLRAWTGTVACDHGARRNEQRTAERWPSSADRRPPTRSESHSSAWSSCDVWAPLYWPGSRWRPRCTRRPLCSRVCRRNGGWTPGGPGTWARRHSPCFLSTRSLPRTFSQSSTHLPPRRRLVLLGRQTGSRWSSCRLPLHSKRNRFS